MSLVVKPDFLPAELAERVATAFEHATDWTRLRNDGQYHAEHVGMEFAGPKLPGHDETYWADFHTSMELKTAPAVVEAVRLIMRGGRASDYRCYRMEPGEGFRIHSDSYFGGRYAFTLYFNRRWVWDWGGLLHVISNDGASCRVVLPEFNLLAAVDYQVKAPHFVSPVAAWAKQLRIRARGLWRNGDSMTGFTP